MKAITLVERALTEFEEESGMIPRVILLPRRIFEQYALESKLLEDVLPMASMGPRDESQWTDVRVVEHETIEAPEVY